MTDNIIQLHQNKEPDTVVINEAYFEGWTSDQLAYRAWTACDLAEEILFDDDAEEDAARDARYEVLVAQYALRVLVKRLVGMPATEAREQVRRALLARGAAEMEPRP